LMCRTIYPILEVQDCFLFQSTSEKLRRLRENEDFTIEKGQYLILNPSLEVPNTTISIRYSHNPVFHVIDIPRAVMTTPEFDKNEGKTVDSRLPLLASVRLSQYLLNLNTRNGDWLLDNTDYNYCKDGQFETKESNTCTTAP